MNENSMNFSKFLEIITRLLTNQSTFVANKLNWILKFDSKQTRIITILMVIIWLQSASIITKSFNGVLLNSYFNIRTEPIFTTLTVISSRRISVAAVPAHFDDVNKHYIVSKKAILRLKKKATAFRNGSRHVFPQEIFRIKHFNNLIKGKTVVICNTLLRERYQRQFVQHKKLFTIAPQKFSPDFLNFIVNKDHFLADQFKFMYFNLTLIDFFN